MVPAVSLLFQIAASEPVLGDACPSVAEVRSLVVDEKARTADFVLEDLGPRFVLRAAGESRIVDEPAHDCAARAKMAAVVLTALVAPPFAEDKPPPPPPPSPSSPPPTPPPVRTTRWLLGVGSTVDLAPGGDGRDAFGSVGVSVRGGWTETVDTPSFGATIGASLYAPVTFTVGSTSARMTRTTIDASAHLQGAAGPLTVRASAGPALDLHDIEGTGPHPSGAFRVLFGARSALEILLPLSRTFSASIELSFLLLPSPGDLALHTVGNVGREPAVYLGGTVRLWAGL